MGCDIHLSLERKSRDGVWEDANLYTSSGEMLEFYRGRDYELFGILADVRRPHHLGSIDVLRGIPDDACKTTKEKFCDDEWYHSATHYTFQELRNSVLKYSVAKRSGMVDKKTADRYHRMGEAPTSWCRSTSSPDYVELEWYDKSYALKHFVDAFDVVVDMYYGTWEPENFRVVIAFDN